MSSPPSPPGPWTSAAGRAPAVWALVAACALAGCGTAELRSGPPVLPPAELRAIAQRLLPSTLPDRAGWAADMQAAFAALDLPSTVQNLCAVMAVTEQESSYRADPTVPRLGAIARKEIDERAERAGMPQLAVRAALALASSDGRSYAERIEAATTERELSELFEDFIDRIPLGRSLLARRNPVRTGGPMQVSIAFAEAQAQARRYPYPVRGSIRHEMFTRRGGLYFGVAHLLDYPAPYAETLYRFADFNAGRWASRNAAFQKALGVASGSTLALDGDLLLPNPDAPPGATESAALGLAPQLGLRPAEVRQDLQRGDGPGLQDTRLYERVFALAQQRDGRPQPRAVLPRIALHSPKITRPLTTEWFARRVDERHQRCLSRAAALAPSAADG